MDLRVYEPATKRIRQRGRIWHLRRVLQRLQDRLNLCASLPIHSRGALQLCKVSFAVRNQTPQGVALRPKLAARVRPIRRLQAEHNAQNQHDDLDRDREPVLTTKSVDQSSKQHVGPAQYMSVSRLR